MTDAQTTWRCTICGYIHQGPAAADCCPVCGASAAEFELFKAPPPQPVIQETKQWRCLNCNYIHDGNNPPDLCPVCGVSPEHFEALQAVISDDNPIENPICVVIIGGGIAGVSAAEAIRNVSQESSITLISSEPCIPYYRLNLTRYLADEIDSASLPIHPESWYADNRIDLLSGRIIKEISTDKQTVKLADDSMLNYDKLILAMGSHSFIPPIAGTELGGVFTLRTAEDARTIIHNLESGTSCVCIGGGVLGIETAGALAKRGGDITLLESHEWLMPRQMNAEAAAILESHMATLGVKLRKNAVTRELQGTNNMVNGVVLQDGERLPCGMVIICTGVRPNTHLARKASLEVNQGIVIDNYLRTSNPNILAAGDVAEHNGTVYGIWGPSQFQGTIAGLNAIGIKTAFGGLPRSNGLKVLGLDMLSIGQFTPADGSYRVIKDRNDDVYRHFVFHDGKMIGCILLGNTEPAPIIKKAIEGQKDFSGLLRGTPDCSAIIKGLKE